MVLILPLLSASVANGQANVNIDFSLIDHKGKHFQLRDLRGRVVLIFFGYTLCPDVCPLELQHMAAALDRVASDSARGLFITLDPEHDRPEILDQYVNHFGSGLIGLTGDREQIDAVARQFRVVYRKNPISINRYTLDHSANLFVIDQRGKLSTIVPFGFPAAHIETLIRELIAE